MATNEQRSGPGIRREGGDLREGDVIHVDDIYAEYGIVVSADPDARIHYVNSDLRARARAVPAYRVIDVDDVLGVDTADATHLYDRQEGRVLVMQRSEDGRSHYQANTFDVSEDALGRYLVWLESEHDREWREYTLPPQVRELLEDARDHGGDGR